MSDRLNEIAEMIERGRGAEVGPAQAREIRLASELLARLSEWGSATGYVALKDMVQEARK